MVLLEFSRYTGDTVGLEKLLRGIQGCMQLIIANPTKSPTLSTYQWPPIALKQCAISRRAFRYFKFIDFAAASTNQFRSVISGTEDIVLGSLEFGKSACMAVYLFLEAFTILHAIGILTSPWGAQVFFEAMKFWFYAISCAMLSLTYQLLLLRNGDEKSKSTPKSKLKKPGEKAVAVKLAARRVEARRSVLFWQLVGVACDLLIPGTFVGWLDVSPSVVAAGTILSAVLSSMEVWQKVNRNRQ